MSVAIVTTEPAFSLVSGVVDYEIDFSLELYKFLTGCRGYYQFLV